MLFVIILSIVFTLFVIFILLLNFNYRFAYFYYKILKKKRLFSLVILRNRKYLRDSVLMFPQSIMPIIDDMGWSNGRDLSPNGPSRLVKNRDPKLDDYANVIDIAKQSGIRIPGAFIISDFDKENVCAKQEYNIPKKNSNLTEVGLNWDNKTSKDYNERLVKLLSNNSKYIEFSLHGVRHEYFDETGVKNAEWANAETGESWGKDYVELHCKVFSEIIRQYFSRNKFSFPNFFVPPKHTFSLYSDDLKVLNSYGIKRFSCSCSSKPSMRSLINSGLYKDGVLLMDRTELYGITKEGYVPKFIPVNYWIGTHFPNFWGKSVKKWVRYLKKLEKNYDTMVGKNSVDNASQWIYSRYTACRFDVKNITINNLYMPDWAYDNDFINGIWLKVHMHGKNKLSKLCVDGLKIIAVKKDDYDNVYLRLASNREDGALEKKIYKGTYTVDKKPIDYTYIDIDKETYVVKNLFDDGKSLKINLTLFGEHQVIVKLKDKILDAKSLDGNANDLFVSENTLVFNACTSKMNGEDKTFNISYKVIGE